MSEWATLREWLPAINTPLLLFLVWLVARIYVNHLPHLVTQIDAATKSVNDRIDRLYAESLTYRHEFNRRISILEGEEKGRR